tara:strand:+ start:173 stop:376 length:204 start_codon:yes stop_codon:yes gene_type:complete
LEYTHLNKVIVVVWSFKAINMAIKKEVVINIIEKKLEPFSPIFLPTKEIVIKLNNGSITVMINILKR